MASPQKKNTTFREKIHDANLDLEQADRRRVDSSIFHDVECHLIRVLQHVSNDLQEHSFMLVFGATSDNNNQEGVPLKERDPSDNYFSCL